MAVVKANAYGHGLHLVAPQLFDAGCRRFAVTDATEGAQLRQLLNSDTAEIALLSGIFDREEATLATETALTPVITHPDQIAMLKAAGFHGAVWIKVDTGMHRLGAEDPQALRHHCQRAAIQLRGMMSHLACADTPEHPMNRQQAERFARLCQQTDSLLPHSLLNSAGMISMPDQMGSVVRPGIALYGSEPVQSHPIGLKPVMSMQASVIHIRHIDAGESLSYGATFTASGPMRIAVVSAGYGDGIPRALSNCGEAIYRNHILPITGRVCMDYTLLDATGTDIKPGNRVEFWGDQLPANSVASLIDSISYTLFIGVTQRVARVAVV